MGQSLKKLENLSASRVADVIMILKSFLLEIVFFMRPNKISVCTDLS